MPPKEKSKELKHRNIICLKLTDIELEILNQAASSVGESLVQNIYEDCS